jgi:hypothetical protein
MTFAQYGFASPLPDRQAVSSPPGAIALPGARADRGAPHPLILPNTLPCEVVWPMGVLGPVRAMLSPGLRAGRAALPGPQYPKSVWD